MSDIIRSHQQRWGEIAPTGTRSVGKAGPTPEANQEDVKTLRKALKRSEQERSELETELQQTRSILSNVMARLKTADKICEVENCRFGEEIVQRFSDFKNKLMEVTSRFETGLGGLIMHELRTSRTAIRSIIDNLDVDPTNDDSRDIYSDGVLSTSYILQVVREKFSNGDSFTLSHLTEWLQVKHPNVEFSLIEEVIEKRCEAGLKENNMRTISQKKIGAEVHYYLKDLSLTVDVGEHFKTILSIGES